jgi:hypothetical protein
MMLGTSCGVWKQLFELFRSALFLTHDVGELRAEVTQLREEMNDVQRALNQLVHNFELLSEWERLEREKHILRTRSTLWITKSQEICFWPEGTLQGITWSSMVAANDTGLVLTCRARFAN